MTYQGGDCASAQEAELLGEHLDNFITRLFTFTESNIVSAQVFRYVQNAHDLLLSVSCGENEETTLLVKKHYHGQKGRPSYLITEKQLSFLLDLHFTLKDISKIIGVSVRTIERRMEQYGLEANERLYSQISETEIEDIIKEIKQAHPPFGYRQVMGILHSKIYG